MIIDQLESKIKTLPYDKVVPFSYIDIKYVTVDTRRQYLHIINVTGESYRLKQKREAGLLDISNK